MHDNCYRCSYLRSAILGLVHAALVKNYKMTKDVATLVPVFFSQLEKELQNLDSVLFRKPHPSPSKELPSGYVLVLEVLLFSNVNR